MKGRINMRLKIQFENKKVSLRQDYMHQLQSAIYKTIFNADENMHGKIQFTFSRLMSNRRSLSDKQIELEEPFLIIGSLDEKLIDKALGNIYKSRELIIGNTVLELANVIIEDEKYLKLSDKTVFKTISPVVLVKSGQHNEELVNNVNEQSFKAVKEINRLARKSIEVKNKKLLNFDIVPVSHIQMRFPVYNGAIFPSWEGHFRIIGDQEARNIVYHSGLGSKTNCGFGCLDMVV